MPANITQATLQRRVMFSSIETRGKKTLMLEKISQLSNSLCLFLGQESTFKSLRRTVTRHHTQDDRNKTRERNNEILVPYEPCCGLGFLPLTHLSAAKWYTALCSFLLSVHCPILCVCLWLGGVAVKLWPQESSLNLSECCFFWWQCHHLSKLRHLT